MDKIIVKEFFTRNWKNIIIIVLLLLCFQQCNKSKSYLLESKISKTKAKEYLQLSRDVQQKLKLVVLNYDNKIDSIQKVEQANKSKYIELSKSIKVKLSDLKHYSTTDNTNYFKTRYNDAVNVIQAEKGTTLKDSVSKKVIKDLIIGDVAKEEVNLLKKDVVLKEAKFQLSNATVDSLKLGLESVSKNYELANAEKDKSILKTEQALQNEKDKKNVWKIISGALAVGSGYLLFVK